MVTTVICRYGPQVPKTAAEPPPANLTAASPGCLPLLDAPTGRHSLPQLPHPLFLLTLARSSATADVAVAVSADALQPLPPCRLGRPNADAALAYRGCSL